MRFPSTVWILAVAFPMVGACKVAIEELGREVGVIAVHPSVSGRDVGQSALVGGRSLWVFGDTPLLAENAAGQTWLSSSSAVTDDFDASDGISELSDPVDEIGEPRELLPFTAAEARFNEDHESDSCMEDCGARIRLWPGALVSEPGTGNGWLVYTKLIARPDAELQYEPLGSSIALVTDPEGVPERPESGPDSADPTILFPPGSGDIGAAAVATDEHLYGYGCELVGVFEFRCTVARAPLPEVFEPGSWRFWDGADWQDTSAQAVSVMNGAPIMSVQYNEHLRLFWCVYVRAPDNVLMMRTAEAPEGPWTDERGIHRVSPPDGDGWIYDAVAHGELARENGRIQYVTYSRENGFLQSELRLVEIVLE